MPEIPLEIGRQVWRFGMSLDEYQAAAADLIDAGRQWIVNFRSKGENAQSGGFFRCASTGERDEVADVLKDAGYRVVWEPVDA